MCNIDREGMNSRKAELVNYRLQTGIKLQQFILVRQFKIRKIEAGRNHTTYEAANQVLAITTNCGSSFWSIRFPKILDSTVPSIVIIIISSGSP
jgi:hypothetical protein